MKAKDLAKILSENPDFDVVADFFEGCDSLGNHDSDWGASLRTFEISGYSVSHAHKRICLDIREIDS